MRGDTEIDTSAEYKNALGILPNLPAMLSLIETSILMWGQASIGLIIGLSMIVQGMILLFKVILGPSDKEVNSRKRVS
jgi:hypothetical protein